MKKLKWWFRIVGMFYLFLTAVNLYAVFLNNRFLKIDIPFPVDEVAFRITLDFWLTFVLDLLVMGAFMIWASRNPLKHINIAWLILWLEAIRGVADDFYLVARGYSAPFYTGFTIIHLVIIITGYIFIRQASMQLTEVNNLTS